jgi:hypothetical protein
MRFGDVHRIVRREDVKCGCKEGAHLARRNDLVD